MIRSRFIVGDVVRVKTLDELRKELGENIETPCNFVEEMYDFCGQCMQVVGVYNAYDDKNSFYYALDGGGSWNFDECVLDDFFIADEPQDEPQFDLANITMNYESLF